MGRRLNGEWKYLGRDGSRRRIDPPPDLEAPQVGWRLNGRRRRKKRGKGRGRGQRAQGSMPLRFRAMLERRFADPPTEERKKICYELILLSRKRAGEGEWELGLGKERRKFVLTREGDPSSVIGLRVARRKGVLSVL